MNKLPDSCKDCAEYGSHFCDECLREMTEQLPAEEQVLLTKVFDNIVNNLTDRQE